MLGAPGEDGKIGEPGRDGRNFPIVINHLTCFLEYCPWYVFEISLFYQKPRKVSSKFILFGQNFADKMRLFNNTCSPKRTTNLYANESVPPKKEY